MANPFQDTLNELMAEYDKARDDLTKMQKTVQATSGKARSKNRMLSVEVDGRGDITELKFHNQTWRTMAPGELCKLIVQTIKEAQENARKEAYSSMSSLLPAGVDVSELVSGNIDWSAATPEEFGLPAIVEEFLGVSENSADADGKRPKGDRPSRKP
jgi:DNA-binding protein YbaB